MKHKPVMLKPSYLSRKRAKLTPSLFQLFELNDNCLLNVFECLDLISLAKMCKTCKRFRELIMHHIIPSRTIDFSKIRRNYSVRKMFALFGKSMQRIVMDSDDIQITMPGYSRFAEFLRMLVEYGEPGKLKDVRLSFGGHFCHVSEKLLQDVGPYFSQVRKLEMNCYATTSDDVNSFMNAIDKTNLRELCVHNIFDVGEWLSESSLGGLQKIHLCLFFSYHARVNALNESRLVHFISNKPASLVAFECTGAPTEDVFVELSRHIPNIERLDGIRYWPNDATGHNNNNGGAGGIVPQDFHAKWKYFNAFTNLKDVTLRSTSYDFSDSGEAFNILAKRQTIERLELMFGCKSGDQGNPVKISDLKQLTRLKTLELHILCCHDEQSKEFVSTLFANLPALTTCTYHGKSPTQLRVIELIKSAKNLKVLKLCSGFSSFSVPFYKKLVKCRTPADDSQNMDGNENRLVLHIDGEIARKCVNELGKRYKPSIVTLRSI